MELPNRHLAYVPEDKITGYLLNLDHLKGGGKARVFRGRGYDESNVSAFIADLVALAQTAPVVDVRQDNYGIRYVIDGAIQTPDGRCLRVRTVWMMDMVQDAPWLISAYPNDSEI